MTFGCFIAIFESRVKEEGNLEKFDIVCVLLCLFLELEVENSVINYRVRRYFGKI